MTQLRDMTQIVDAGHSDTPQRQHAGTEPSDPECSGALFSFRGHPGGVAGGEDGAVWVSDSLSTAIWQVSADGTAVAILAPSVSRHLGGCGAEPFAPAGLAVAPDGTLYVADSGGHRICAVGPDGSARVVAGGANGYRDGVGSQALFRYPLDVAFSRPTARST